MPDSKLKLCTLLSRSELRDLVDVRELERAGQKLKEGLAGAASKDAGLTPGQLVWVLSDVRIADDASPPGGVSVPELRSFLQDLIKRLSLLAFPG